jgi:hypothetical protein
MAAGMPAWRFMHQMSQSQGRRAGFRVLRASGTECYMPKGFKQTVRPRSILNCTVTMTSASRRLLWVGVLASLLQAGGAELLLLQR